MSGRRLPVLILLLLAFVVPPAAANAASPGDTATGEMNTATIDSTATRLHDGTVLVVGGRDPASEDPLASAEVYDPATGTWTEVGRMAGARWEPTATLLADGRVLVVGGWDVDGSPLHSAELYDPVTKTWSSAGATAVGHAEGTATRLTDGRVLVAGGAGDTDGSFGTTSAELYDPDSNSWSPAAPMGLARVEQTAVRLGDGRVLVLQGGAIVPSNVEGLPQIQFSRLDGEIYDPAADAWSPASDDADTSRLNGTATLLNDGRVLLAGGILTGDVFGVGVAFPEIYDPATDTWSRAGSLGGLDPDWYHHPQDPTGLIPGFAAFRQTGGRVLLVGNRTALLYDPAQNAWHDAGSLLHGHIGGVAARLADGRVLVAGGAEVNVALGNTHAELRDPYTTLSAAPVHFGAQTVGTTSGAASIDVANTGDSPLLEPTVTLAGANPGDFHVVSSACVLTPPGLAPGTTCPIAVTFSPTALGGRSATLVVGGTTTPAGAYPVRLSGTGSAAVQGPQGPRGTKGPKGARGKPGRNATVKCAVHRRKGHRRITCTVHYAKSTRGHLQARLTRHGRTYARASARLHAGRAALRLAGTRRLRAGRYVLHLRLVRGGHARASTAKVRVG